MSLSTPPAEWQIDEQLVQTLLLQQHRDLAHLPIEPLASGWDNKMFRLGSELIVRLPRRAVAVGLMTKEHRWLPQLAKRLPLPIPAPVRHGAPIDRYPSPWSVLPWLRGVCADEQPCRADQAVVLGQFLKALHTLAPPDLPRNPVRGVPLTQRAAAVKERLDRLERKTRFVTAGVRSFWKQAIGAPPLETEETWIHGDLHARYVLVERGRLSAVIDWGDLCRGDPATDLASLWMLLPNARARNVARAAYGTVSDSMWLRARGWAVAFAAVLLDTGLIDHPRHAAMGETTFRRLAEES
jgi:aminoglycoside phosphotransferase (APT) family kinase protein